MDGGVSSTNCHDSVSSCLTSHSRHLAFVSECMALICLSWTTNKQLTSLSEISMAFLANAGCLFFTGRNAIHQHVPSSQKRALLIGSFRLQKAPLKAFCCCGHLKQTHKTKCLRNQKVLFSETIQTIRSRYVKGNKNLLFNPKVEMLFVCLRRAHTKHKDTHKGILSGLL